MIYELLKKTLFFLQFLPQIIQSEIVTRMERKRKKG